ncbi:MAG: hypothetical protein JSW07_05585 [bacterium]|nr:MAG: hypothetical protein JSW07_05585 [bacterium]
MKVKKEISLLIILSFILLSSTLEGFSQSIAFHSKLFGFHIGGQLTFDIYKPFGSVFMNMRRLESPVALQKGEEIDIYSRLGRRLLFPSYLLLQASGYSLSALSSYLETDHLNHFNRFRIHEQINLLRSIGVGFEEPYAFSLFLGNILFLSYYDSSQTKRKQSGSALAGFLVSTGKHQIYNNIYLHDQWYQIELMLIGNLNEPQRRHVSWNFRIGAKFHQTKLLRNKFTLSIERSYTDWWGTGLSIFKNSVFNYQGHFPMPFTENKTPSASQLITYGKKFPTKLFKRKVFFVLSLGVRWEWVRFYDHDLNQFELDPSSQFIWLIQPNVEF